MGQGYLEDSVNSESGKQISRVRAIVLPTILAVKHTESTMIRGEAGLYFAQRPPSLTAYLPNPSIMRSPTSIHVDGIACWRVNA